MITNPAELISQAAQILKGLLILMVIFVPLELVFSQRSYPLIRSGLFEDLGYYVMNSILPKFLLAGLVSGLVLVMRPIYAKGVYDWLSHLPLAWRFGLAVIVGDIGAYWGHRWSHESPLLWHFHRIHHQSTAIDWLVTSRAHPIDMVFTRFCGVVLIYLTGLAGGSLGQGTSVMATYVLIGGLWGFFVHANLGWRFGFLERWLATPAFHHWHHSNESPESIDKNYAAIFPWIDWLFATLYLPSQRWPRTYGLTVPAALPAEPGQLNQQT